MLAHRELQAKQNRAQFQTGAVSEVRYSLNLTNCFLQGAVDGIEFGGVFPVKRKTGENYGV